MGIDALQERYPLVETRIALAGREWRITCVQNQDILVSQVRTEEDLRNFAYGLILWPSALGLAHSLISRQSLLAGKRLLEIGAGVGVAGLIAAHLGAQVTQTDFLDDILALCRHNAVVNGHPRIVVRKGDWRDWPDDLGLFPLVIASDVLYEREMHPILRYLLPRLVTPGGEILLSDPLRPQALDFVEQLERDGNWQVAMEPLSIAFEGQTKDLALFRLTRQTA